MALFDTKFDIIILTQQGYKGSKFGKKLRDRKFFTSFRCFIKKYYLINIFQYKNSSMCVRVCSVCAFLNMHKRVLVGARRVGVLE